MVLYILLTTYSRYYKVESSILTIVACLINIFRSNEYDKKNVNMILLM